MPLTPPNAYEIEHLREEIAESGAKLGMLIARTPTSEKRNALTDANVFLMQARKSLDRAKVMR